MGKTPDQLRNDIQDTREQMAGTVDALAYKADVPQRVRDGATRQRSAMAEKVDRIMGTARGQVPSGDDVAEGGRQAMGTARSNPLGLALGAAAAGFLVGMLVPSTRFEDERIGSTADTLKREAAQTAQEGIERAQQVAQEAGSAAATVAQDSGGRHAQELGEQARQGAQETAQQAQRSASRQTGRSVR